MCFERGGPGRAFGFGYITMTITFHIEETRSEKLCEVWERKDRPELADIASERAEEAQAD